MKREELQPGCFVIDPSELTMTGAGSMRWMQLIGDGDKARALSLFCVDVHAGKSPAIQMEAEEAVLYLLRGQCTVSICGQRFAAGAGSGLHVRQHEHFLFINDSDEVARWLVSICPRKTGLDVTDKPGGEFDAHYPERRVHVDHADAQATGDRSYKLLVGPSIGSHAVTQFIGRIPPSRAPEHFHLYEEAICILSGHGRMWAGDRSMQIRPGSIIFLPRKQSHCLECLDEEGLELMGVFYPAGSPAINYKTARARP